MKRVILGILFFLCSTSIVYAVTIGPYNHTWDGTEPTMADRLLRNGVASNDPPPKPFPGTFPGPVYYLTYSFFNNSNVSSLVTVAATNSDLNSFFSLYDGTFDPTNLSSGYLGDAGSSTTNQLFTVEMPAFSDFTLVANSVTLNVIGQSYSVQISGDNISTAAVPEPSTFLLLGAGLGGFALYRRRMKK